MMLNRVMAEYTLRCLDAGNLLPRITSCEECGNDFGDTFAAEDSGHGVIRLPDRTFSVIIGCEGYHQIRF